MAEMGVELMVNDRSEIIILHDTAFKTLPSGIRYNPSSGTVYLDYPDQDMQYLGMDATPDILELFKKAQTVMLVYMKDKKDIEKVEQIPISTL